MEEDKVEDEFASFKRRLESRPGKDDERNDALQEGEAKSDTPEASDCSSGSEGGGEVCISCLMFISWLRLSLYLPAVHRLPAGQPGEPQQVPSQARSSRPGAGQEGEAG